uniref:Glutamine amidotransferase type-1 domain-containing protein n=1 Tax=Caenorhabditis japonica TaxID=281687 RepID=A0A8R1IQY0_CAEJA
MVGYVESLTDPSYARQLLTLTYPLIGNYGVPNMEQLDQFGLPAEFESDRVWPAALIVEKLCMDGEHSHWQAVQSLSEWLRKADVPCLSGIDVRQLVKKIRETGTMKAKLVVESDNAASYEFVDINASNLVDVVSRKEPVTFGTGEQTIMAVDCGLKNNQIRCLAKRGFKVKVVPWNHPIDTEKDYDGLFLSNGPGDPEVCGPLVDRLAKVIARGEKPVFGICLGHQIISRAIGAKTYKLK